MSSALRRLTERRRTVTGVSLVMPASSRAFQLTVMFAPDTSVTVRLRSVSLRKALDMVLQEAGGGDKLAYDLDQGVIAITTRELADARMYTRVYPCLLYTS